MYFLNIKLSCFGGLTNLSCLCIDFRFCTESKDVEYIKKLSFSWITTIFFLIKYLRGKIKVLIHKLFVTFIEFVTLE